MKTDYNAVFSIRVKARAKYTCEKCGATEFVQAHAPNGDHSDWARGICLCAGHHADEHPNVPRTLFFSKGKQPYWPNISASTIARLAGCNSRTIIRVVRRLGINRGLPLSSEDRLLVCSALRRPRLSDEKKLYIVNYCALSIKEAGGSLPNPIKTKPFKSIITPTYEFHFRYIGNIFTKEMTKDKPLLKPEVVATRLGVPENMIRWLIENGELRAIRVTPRQYRIEEKDIAQFLDRFRTQPLEQLMGKEVQTQEINN